MAVRFPAMDSTIQRRFEALEARRAAMVAKVDAMPLEQQTKRPDGKGFSPVQVIQHMAITEEFDLTFLRNNPPPTIKDRKVRVTFIFNRTLKQMESLEKRIPTPPMLVPRGDMVLATTAGRWSAARVELRGFFEQAEDPHEAFIKFNFLFGTASADQLLTFLEGHMTYHEHFFPS
jgi:hypothetical protein